MQDLPSENDLRAIYNDAKNIAVVGISTDPNKESHTVPLYLQQHGFRIIPVNPKGGEILGEKVHASLDSIEEPIDIVSVFRPSDETPPIAHAAAAKGAKVIWLQPGISSEETANIAEAAGMTAIMDRCIRSTHRELFPEDRS